MTDIVDALQSRYDARDPDAWMTCLVAKDEIERLLNRDGFISKLSEQIVTKDLRIEELASENEFLRVLLWDIHSVCNLWPLVRTSKIKKIIRAALEIK